MRAPLDFFRPLERRAAVFRPPLRAADFRVDRLRVVDLRRVAVAFRAAGLRRVVLRFALALRVVRFRVVALRAVVRRAARFGFGSASDGMPIPLGSTG